MSGLMQYSTQSIICLDTGLYRTAKGLQAKRRLAGDKFATFPSGAQLERSKLYLPGSPINLAREYRHSASRMIIVAHGNDESTYIMGESPSGRQLQWTPSQLATVVQYWLDGSTIKTISLFMCEGGGNKGNAVQGPGEGKGAFLKRFAVDPRNSFGYFFARECGLAERITARTGDLVTTVWNTSKNIHPDDDDYEDSVTKMTAEVDGVVKGKAYKVVFFPDPAARAGTPLKPVGMTVLNSD